MSGHHKHKSECANLYETGESHMKLLSKIKAFFRFQNQDAELEVSAAAIKDGMVILHPAEEQQNIYCIQSSAVDIIINSHENICEDDLLIIPAEELLSIHNEKDKPQAPPKDKTQKTKRNADDRQTYERKWIKNKLQERNLTTKTISFSVYPDEYEMLMTKIETSGYKKTEFLLACVNAAKKVSLDANCKKYTVQRQARLAEKKQIAKLAREQAHLHFDEKIS